MKERTFCLICGTDIVIGDMTRWKDNNYYCANCQIDLNRKLDYDKIIDNRKRELEEQLEEINKLKELR